MVRLRLAAHPKKARRQRGNILFIDESGLLMGPLARRTWAPRGQTPVLLQRGRHREKVSLVAALWLSSDGEPVRLSYRSLADDYFNNVAVAGFLTELLAEADRPLIVVWDGGNMHRGDPIRELLTQEPKRLHLERLPTYAPMLNPIEQLWSWLKYGRLNNYAPVSLQELHAAIGRELRSAQRSHNRIQSLWNACALAN